MVLTFGLRTLPGIAAADGWGASYSFNAISPATNHLISAKTTLVPGRLPPIESGKGPLFIWPGLSNGKGDLIQTTLDAWGDNKGACGAATGQWCGETSIFGSFGQLSGSSAAFDPDDHITIEYKLGADNTTWTQTMTSMKLGKVVSTYSRASGAMLAGGFGFATEADQDSYTIDTQYYLCTEFHLAAADPTWGPKSGGGNGAKYGATGMGSGAGTAKNLHTPDGGLTWLVDLITLPAMNPQGTQTPPPAINCGNPGSGGMTGSGGNGGASSTGGHGGTSAVGGSTATGGRSGSTSTGGAPSSGGSSATNGGNAGTEVAHAGTTSETSGTGGSSNMGGQIEATGGHSTTGGVGPIAGSGHGGQRAHAGNGSAAPGNADTSGGCSCGVPSKRTAPRELLAIAIGSALALRLRRTRKEHARSQRD